MSSGAIWNLEAAGKHKSGPLAEFVIERAIFSG
jgi:hypothetical protein